MLKSSLCDYSDAYILIKGTILVPNKGIAAAVNNRNKKVIFKNCTPFTDRISEINNKEIHHAKDIDVVMPMYNLTEYSDNYSKYYKNEPFINNNGVIFGFPLISIISFIFDFTSFQSKQKITGQTGNDGTRDVQIMVPLKYSSNI